MPKVAIVSYARTPIGTFLGSLSTLEAPKLASYAIKQALAKTNIAQSEISEVILGQVLSAGVGQAPARQAALLSEIPAFVPATTVNKVCGSGLKAVMMGVQSILLGESSIVIAGGMESMSNAPYLLKQARTGWKFADKVAEDAMLLDGLTDPYSKKHMGMFGETCASKYEFSRQAQDEFAIQSYEKAIVATKNACFKDEIINVLNLESDEELLKYKPEKIPHLKPAFDAQGSITAANASKLNDGACALILASEAEVKKRNLKPLAWIKAYATFAQSPEWFTTAPVGAIQKVLEKAKVALNQVDFFEINEAFAVVPMAAIKDLSLDPKKVNPYGGAIALGHPIGCSGARILATLVTALHQQNKQIGCATICLGGGEAVSVLVHKEGL